MNEALKAMLERYACQTQDAYVGALREIMQRIALLGLWRAKFFEHAAFYGGTALRVLYGLERYSEDLDFSLLKPNAAFSLGAYGESLCRELKGFEFDVSFAARPEKPNAAIRSAFIKANTLQHLVVIQMPSELTGAFHAGETVKIKLEVDTDPPGGFEVESRPVLMPIPFAVQVYKKPDLFAGKMHALLCRAWRNRVKGRDWYDLVWYLGHCPQLHLSHLEARMRSSGDWSLPEALDREKLFERLRLSISKLDVARARQEVEPFVRDKSSLALWSREFFLEIINGIEIV